MRLPLLRANWWSVTSLENMIHTLGHIGLMSLKSGELLSRGWSSKMTNNIAQRASLGKKKDGCCSLKASDIITRKVVGRLQRPCIFHLLPSDARWAILFVAVGDKN